MAACRSARVNSVARRSGCGPDRQVPETTDYRSATPRYYISDTKLTERKVKQILVAVLVLLAFHTSAPAVAGGHEEGDRPGRGEEQRQEAVREQQRKEREMRKQADEAEREARKSEAEAEREARRRAEEQAREARRYEEELEAKARQGSQERSRNTGGRRTR